MCVFWGEGAFLKGSRTLKPSCHICFFLELKDNAVKFSIPPSHPPQPSSSCFTSGGSSPGLSLPHWNPLTLVRGQSSVLTQTTESEVCGSVHVNTGHFWGKSEGE